MGIFCSESSVLLPGVVVAGPHRLDDSLLAALLQDLPDLDQPAQATLPTAQ